MDETVVIDTKLGKLRGRVAVSAFTEQKYYSFRGIPYAKPPIGQLRFKAPEPFGGWESVRDALEDGNDTKQRIMFRLPGTDPDKEHEGDEDCLFLCVYMKELPESGSKKPVMVNIHGGGFFGGSGGSKAAGPDYFMGTDIVLVSFNYRCGAFGFLSLENDEVPGNAGLKDQTLALRWVQDNIDSFGGDPGNVTIFGVSAGGASVHYHLLSPLSRGLFQKAIMQSGFAQNTWALQQSPKKAALKLAKLLGCTSEEPGEVLEFLRSASSDDILEATKELGKDEDYMLFSPLFTPCVEKAGSEKFLHDTPWNLMKRGEHIKVPTIIGVCQNEGSVIALFSLIYMHGFELLPNMLSKNPDLLFPPTLKLAIEKMDHVKVQKAIRDFYFNGENPSVDDYDSLMKFESDLQFNIGFGETRHYLLQDRVPVYTYLFTNHKHCYCNTFLAMMSPDNPINNAFKRLGTCHGTDCMYLYRMTNGLPMPELTNEFKEWVSRHIKAWTTFATTGNPSVEDVGVSWDQDSQSKPCYMQIGTEWTMMEGVPFSDRINFWLKLQEKYYRD